MTRRVYEKPVLVKHDTLPLVVATGTNGGSGGASDRRLKADVVQVGQLRAGIPLYRFRYLGRNEVYIGVMAQDVLPLVPDAVIADASGFMRVDYARLGTRMMTLAEWETNGLAVAA
jgi:hypothetical protein